MRPRQAHPAALLALALAGACRTAASAEGPVTTGADAAAITTARLVGPTWTLVRLDGAPPEDVGSQVPTIVFEPQGDIAPRAGGSAGCNRWGAAYTLGSDEIRFVNPFTTKRACARGMELERRFVAMIAAVRTIRLAGDTLTLRAPGGSEGVFVRR